MQDFLCFRHCYTVGNRQKYADGHSMIKDNAEGLQVIEGGGSGVGAVKVFKSIT